jgi:hypothetical protein
LSGQSLQQHKNYLKTQDYPFYFISNSNQQLIMTVNGLLPSHHAHRDEHSPRSNSTSSVCASKKNETSLIMMVGLVAMVLVSTQSVLSAIATQSSSQKLVVDGLNYIHDVQQQQPSTTIDMSHHPLPTDGASRTQAAPSPPSSSKRTTSVVLQEIGWMQAVVEYRVKMANIAYEMEQRRRNHEKEILQEAARGNYTMDISPLYDLVSEMVRRSLKFPLQFCTKMRYNILICLTLP